MQTKICTKCKNKCLATTEYFYANKQGKNGLRSQCIKCMREKHRKYRFKNKEKRVVKQRERHIKNTYGLTLEQYDQLFQKQNGVCIICGRINKNGRRLFIDHDHKTGKIRGLLCYRCNSLLGFANDDITLLLKIINYLNVTN